MENQKPIVLQIGLSNWDKKLSDQQSEEIDWHFLEIGSDITRFHEDYSHFLEKRQFDVVLCTDKVSNQLLKEFSCLIEAYQLIVDETLKNEVSDEIIREKCPLFLNISDKNKIIAIISQFFFPVQIQQGTKLHISELTVNRAFEGEKRFVGQNFVELNGNFSKKIPQNIISWQYNIDMRGRSKKIWLEFERDEGVSLTLSVIFLQQGTGKVLKVKDYFESQVKSGIEIAYEENIGYLGIALKASGEGKLRIGPLHYRDSRGDFGEYIPGGKKLVDKNNQEIYYYFNPGDLKPPLAVYFSGYRSAEGFEGFRMMKKMGKPFLLFTDPRLEGGAFYLGSEVLENQVIQTIKKSLDDLGFTQKQLILSGLSMGAFGALYYGCHVTAHTIIVGKPLVNLGLIASNSTLVRPGQFETSLDVLYLATQEVSEASIKRLNDKFWSAFDAADFSKTKFKVAYMKNDDYDPQAYTNLVQHLFDKKNTIIGKGIAGRHNDDSAAVTQWFKTQYRETLKLDFSPISLGVQNQQAADLSEELKEKV